jgi:general secretion pathway protein D
MRRTCLILLAGLLVTLVPAFAAGDNPAAADPPVSCGNGIPGGINCVPSRKDLKEAREAFSRGLHLRSNKRWEEAFALFDEASRLVPQDTQFVTAREMMKAQLVFDHVERGNALLAEKDPVKAAAEFKAAINLDPENHFAQQRLEDALRDSVPTSTDGGPTLLEDSGEIHLQPEDERATFHYRGDTRGLFTTLTAAYGVATAFDESVPTKQVLFNIDDVDFFTALKLACQVSKTMWAALDAHQILVAADTQENHRHYDRMSLRTFLLPEHSTTQEATELVTTMRNVFDLRFVSSGQTANTVEIRAPQPFLAALTQLTEQLGTHQRPQVMFDVRVYQINHQFTRDIGLHIPYTFNLFNIPAVALAGLGGQSIQNLINQLIASGGINQAGNTALSSLLAQLGGQQNSIFSQPLATFGGGLTFMGLSLDKLSAALSVNESWVQSLEHMTLRASQGNDATFHLGTRYPILNASYAPIFNSPQISQVLGNQTFVPPFPSVSYEDLGLNVKVKPTIHGNGDVSLQLELQVRSLTGQSSNGVPVISNREYKGSINLSDGEPAVVAGQISRTDQRSLSGLPGFGVLPLISNVASQNTKQEEEDELMVVITPHVVANTLRTTPEIWVSEK